MFLVTFQEFEVASRLGATAWTVWLFDAQAGGLALAESLRFVCLPLVCEGIILIPWLWALSKTWQLPAADREPIQMSRTLRRLAWGYLLSAGVLICLIPMTIVARSALPGLKLLINDTILRQELPKEILRSLLFGLISGIVASWIARRAIFNRSRNWASVVTVLALPGLFGSLVLGLILLKCFQLQFLSRFYDTPVPLVLALFLFLLPRALLVQLLLSAMQRGEALHLATLLNASPVETQRAAGKILRWDLAARGQYWGTVLLCNWAYWDLTASAILAPSGMVPAPVRLYNLMHYNQSAVLSAMLIATIGFPILLYYFLAVARRSFWKWCGR